MPLQFFLDAALQTYETGTKVDQPPSRWQLECYHFVDSIILQQQAQALIEL